MELMNINDAVSILFQVASGVAIFTSLWVKVTIDSKLYKELSNYVSREDFKASQHEALEMTKQILSETKHINNAITPISLELKIMQERFNLDKEAKDRELKSIKSDIASIKNTPQP